jgi:uncharacterized protein (DUF3820 family)
MVLPFGKFKGMSVSDAPETYLTWLADQDWLRDPLQTAIEIELDRREGMRSRPPVKIDVEVADKIIASGVRQLSKSAHPDAGGNHELMSRINATADALRELAGVRC